MVTGNIIIEGARILYRNFEGREGRFNSVGKRNFCVLLEKDLADQLIEDGWNVRFLEVKDEYEEPQPYIQVSVAFGYRPPNIVMISSRGQTLLDEESVKALDWAEFQNIDLSMRPYDYDVNGKKGIKAYLSSLYVTIYEDPLELKYANPPLSAQEAMISEFPV